MMLKIIRKETKILRQEARNFFRVFLHPAFAYLVVVGNAILFLAVGLVYHHEKGINPKMVSFLDTLWWGVSTITTVGYGDVVPITTMGRMIGIALMYMGTVLFIAFTGILVTVWMRAEVERELRPLEREVKEVEEELRPLEREVRKEELEERRIEKVLEEIRSRLERLEKKT